MWIGDCLYLDVRGFLAAMAVEDGITFEPTFLTSKNPAEQLEELRRLSDRKFDLIGYSPFTYEFSVEIGGFQRLRRSMMGRREIDRIVAAEMDHAGKMLEVAATLFDAPCYVHNTANVRRHDSSPRELAKVWLTRRARRVVRESINGRLAERIAAWRAVDGSVIMVDETGLLDRYGETALGRLVYPNPIQHPAELGRLLADHYREILAAHADLVGKKVIVCDLDNTLWKGEIGEGAVEHDVAIQGTLKELRRKGVLLTINSKNDPRNVRWDGAVLSEDDFVAAQINWDSKVDEHASHPAEPEPEAQGFRLHRRSGRSARAGPRGAAGDLVLDATSPRVPEAAGHLGGRAVGSSRDRSDAAVSPARAAREPPGGGAAVAEDPGRPVAKLEIRVEIREARASELKRVTELINRTNQFNLAGSRTGLKEMRDWQDRARHARRRGRGPRQVRPDGTHLCALWWTSPGRRSTIPVFVLSCRVFGYGIEDALLNAVKRLARAARAACR